MRTMLIGAVMLLACQSGAARADEASAVKAVEKLGGKVTCDDKLPGKPVIGVNLGGVTGTGNDVTDAVLKELNDLKQLTTLHLGVTQVTAAGLKELKELKQLTSLDLTGIKVTDAGLKELKELKQLTSLNLNGTGVTDAGLKELKELKQLTSLSLGGTKVTADGVADLQKALPDCKINR
jgi:internalin A